MIFAMVATTCCAQQTVVQPDPLERPLKPFSNVIPDGTAWVVTIKKPWELRDEKFGARSKDSAESSYLAKFAGSTIKSIENSYAAGIRREIIHYGDESKFIRYVTKGMIAYLDRTTGEPVLEQEATGPANRLKELDWVSDKYYIGADTYHGRACYVYRQFAPEILMKQDPNAENQEAPPGAASADLKDSKNAKILATAFIDKETMQPLAYETMYEVMLYDKSVAFSAFGLPAPLQQAAQKQAEAIAKRQQKYKLRQ